MRVEGVPFPKPGVLYQIWINDDRTEATYESVFADGRGVVRRLTVIGVDGPQLVEDIVWGPAEDLQQHLEALYANQVWRRTGELVGPYASPAVDLDSLEPAAVILR